MVKGNRNIDVVCLVMRRLEIVYKFFRVCWEVLKNVCGFLSFCGYWLGDRVFEYLKR